MFFKFTVICSLFASVVHKRLFFSFFSTFLVGSVCTTYMYHYVKTSIIIYIYLSTRIYICKCLNMHIYKYIYIYIYVYVHLYIYIYVHGTFVIPADIPVNAAKREISRASQLSRAPERGRLHPIMLTVNNLPKPPSGMSQNRSTPTWHRLCKCRS